MATTDLRSERSPAQMMWIPDIMSFGFSFDDGMTETMTGNKSALIAPRAEIPLLLFRIFYFSSVCPDWQPFPVPLRPLPIFIIVINNIDQPFVLVVLFISK